MIRRIFALLALRDPAQVQSLNLADSATRTKENP